MKTRILVCLLHCGFWLGATLLAQAQGPSAFTYQGRLIEAGSPANGDYDLQFTLYNALSSGAEVGIPVTNRPVAVSNGLFAVILDFGAGAFDGSPRWIQLGVRTNGSAADYFTLSPRQFISFVPYSITALNLAGAVPGGGLAGTYTNAVTFGNPVNSFAGSGAGLSGLNAASVASGTLADARLSGNVSLLNGNQSFTGVNTFGNAGNSFAGSFAGDGASLTNLNGANIASGSVGNAQLAANAVQTANIANGAVGNTQLASGTAVANLLASGQSGVASDGVIFSRNPNSSNLVSAGYVRIGKTVLGVDMWERRTDMPLAGRDYHTVIWTGTEMIVWGGSMFDGNKNVHLGDGARYNPSLNTWTVMSTNGAPSPRNAHSAVWTGSEMIVWGGYGNSTNWGDGARYSPITDSWILVSTNSAPSPRYDHTAVWTASKMIVWGGSSFDGTYRFFADGAVYDPALNTWTAIATNCPLAGRIDHAAKWTGSKMIVWGGRMYDTTWQFFGDGAVYDAVLDKWTGSTMNDAPSPRALVKAVWTGTEMLVWGGTSSPSGSTWLGDGKRYNPATDSWTAIASSAAPSGRYGYTAVWTGNEMIIWGGWGGAYLNTGGRYSPSSDSWQATSTAGAPPGRYLLESIWTGAELIVSGGEVNTPYFFSDTFIYTLPVTLHLFLKP